MDELAGLVLLYLHEIYDGHVMGGGPGGFVTAPVQSFYIQLVTFLVVTISLKLGWQEAFLVLNNAAKKFTLTF